MKRLAEYLGFVDFGNICATCKDNCCKKFYAILLPEEEKTIEHSFDVSTPLGSVKAIGSRKDIPCPYLNERGFCKIYRFRPFDCRVWPVIMYYDFERNEKVIYLDMDCPAAAEDRIPKEVIDKIVNVLKNIDINVEWLKKYTLAPWPNNLKEIARFK
ncbi:MAG: YkgJ family cysteine cluster protein [Ignisphaera sp.]|uniref:YkgJ family cysteine cluster protein n=1 Tax=Ignisphaera aggregans TaxID=334771 RepID=A0A7J3N0N5_9CREN